jgi:glutaredoxin 3
MPDGRAAMVVIYLSQSCPYCRTAVQMLADKGFRWREVDLGEQPERYEEMIQRSGRYSVPQIWIGERHVGGFDDLAALNAAGELDALLRADADAEERVT